MSKYLKIAVKFQSEAALVQALEDACTEFGITYEHHDQPQTLYDWHGEARPEKAEYIIRRRNVGGAANDMGFARQADGTFGAIISQYDSGSYGQKKLDYISYRYQYHQVTEYAYANGFTVVETETPDGVELALERAW